MRAKINGIEGIAFDLDGTLYPNYRFNIRLVPFILKELRLVAAFGRARNIIRKEQETPDFKPKPGESFYLKQAELTAKLLGTDNQSLLIEIENKIYKSWEPIFKKIKLFRSALDTLSALKDAGYKLGLMSDFPPETKLEHLKLDRFPGGEPIWDAVLCSEKCGALKPHPLPFLELAKAMSLPPEKILYAGNSRPYDVKGAGGAGMKTAWIRPVLFPGGCKKAQKADFTFTNYRQLYKYMVK